MNTQQVGRVYAASDNTNNTIFCKLLEALSYQAATRNEERSTFTNEEVIKALSGCVMAAALIAYYQQHEAVIRPLVEGALPEAITRQRQSL